MKKRNYVHILICLALTFMLVCPLTVSAAEQVAPDQKTELFELINQKRTECGSPVLSHDFALDNTSRIRVLEVSTSFLHTRLDGRHFSTALNDSNVPFRRCAEVLAFNCANPEDVLNVWLSSPLHCEAILSSKYTNIGISSYVADDGLTYWTAHLSSQ